MAEERRPEEIEARLKSGSLDPYYLFYGPSEFRLERTVNLLRERFIPESARDFNLQVFYGDEAAPGEIVEAAQSLPFMGRNRLILVRRTDSFPAAALEYFIPYLENPLPSTCLIFISKKTDFKRKFYRKIREAGLAVPFKPLLENQVVPWIRRTAGDMGLNIDGPACAYLHQIVGSRLKDLYSELEKLSLRYKEGRVGVEEVKDLAIRSRTYTIFELMDQISFRRPLQAMSVLDRLLEEQGREEVLGTLGMLTRQIRLLWQVKAAFDSGGEKGAMAGKLGVPDFILSKLVQQAKHWGPEDLEGAFHLLYQADNLLKTGSNGRLLLENLVLALCAKGAVVQEPVIE